jgi:hypothetical protein
LFASLAFSRLAEQTRDLNEARVAIDALKALLGVVSDQQRKDLESVVANLQLAYASAAAASE